MRRRTSIVLLATLLAFLVPYVGYRVIFGNAKTSAVRAIGESIRVGESRASAMRKIDAMRVYEAHISVNSSTDGKTTEITVLSHPGYDHYMKSYVIEDEAVKRTR